MGAIPRGQVELSGRPEQAYRLKRLGSDSLVGYNDNRGGGGGGGGEIVPDKVARISDNQPMGMHILHGCLCIFVEERKRRG